MADRLDDHFRFHQRALSLRAERQQVLASNIANADTPNYRARDIDFRQALQAAVGGTPGVAVMGSSGVGITGSHPAHLGMTGLSAGGSFGRSSVQPLQYRVPHQDSIDGNTVELDAERAQYADNAIRYEANLSAVNGKIKSLLTAIQGQ